MPPTTAEVSSPDVLTVALPTPDTPLSITERLSLRLALWLLLRTDRTRRTVIAAPSRLVAPVTPNATAALSRDNALTLTSYAVLRQLR